MPQPNTTDYTDYFGVLNTDGELAAVATLNAAIGSISINYKTAATSATTTTALTALASATTAHTDNRAFAIAPGNLRVDFPDAPWASGASFVEAWLTFSGGLAGYETAGGTKRIAIGYAPQGPYDDWAKEATLDEVLTDTGTTIPATLTTIGSNASTAATQATTAATQATTAATQSTTAATQSTAAAASAAAVEAKLPTASAKIAGEGTTAKNLDDITVGSVELTEGDITAIAEAVAGEVSAQTITSENVDDDQVWSFDPNSNRLEADRAIVAAVGDELTLQFNLRGKLNYEDTVATVDSLSITDTGATLGTAAIHTSRQRVNTRATDLDTAGTYTVSLQYTTTTSQTRTVTGKLIVEAA